MLLNIFICKHIKKNRCKYFLDYIQTNNQYVKLRNYGDHFNFYDLLNNISVQYVYMEYA